jgi:transcriptional regulator of arginine metabolism
MQIARPRRQAAISEILGLGPVPSQESLLERLAGLGVQTTQATLSRDLREMGVVKTPAGYVLPGRWGVPGWSPAASAGGPAEVGDGSAPGGSVGPVGSVLERTLTSFVTRVVPGVGLVVLHTVPGHASVVALELDRTPPAGVIGTVAGDDAVFVAVDEQARARSLAREIERLSGTGASARGGAA